MSTAEIKTADIDYPVHPLIEQRWSPRVFSDKAVIQQDLQQLLEAVRWSASSNNEQPWRFIYTFLKRPLASESPGAICS